MSTALIRQARAEDVAQILAFITELAIYEKAEREVVATAEDIRRDLFGPHPALYALMMEADGQAVGFAVYFLNYSTWLGRHGIYLEDLYVTPAARGAGYGKQMLQHLAALAVERGYGRMDWSVLDWNQPAIDFYEAAGARAQSDWVGYRLQGQALAEFAAD
ncbi:MAG: GNAT family N-acetyltransferase [Salinisphaera sp.]|jgi:GNAT superfamily N-acetyltransferase|nr:GNAT family N-acetyltransferase [Salinisphaera sp.]